MTPSPTSPEPVAAIVVEYHSGDALLRCVQSLRANQVEEIVVVDNGGERRSLGGLLAGPDVRWITATGNSGFGGGMNLGAAATDAELLLICNPDIELAPGALEVQRVQELTKVPPPRVPVLVHAVKGGLSLCSAARGKSHRHCRRARLAINRGAHLTPTT